MADKFIYADNAATTNITPNVLDAMMPFLTGNFGNASSIYKMGRDAQKAVEDARAAIAGCFGAKPNEIYFTGGGSESDNWAIKSTALRLGAKGKKHIITTAFEHHAVLHTCAALEKQGFEVTYLPVSSDGYVTPEQVRDAIREDTALVSVMYANNEIGTIQPIAEIGKICHEKKVLFHTDAVQAVAKVPISLKDTKINMLSFSGHKIHAPKGIGVLYVRRGTRFIPFMKGGHQERGRRAGTENVPYIVGLGVACELAKKNLSVVSSRVKALRDKLEQGILKAIPDCFVTGDESRRTDNTLNVAFKFVEGEAILLMLNEYGIAASSGSACSSESLEPSHVMRAMNVPFSAAHGTIRFSLSRFTTEAEIDKTIEVLPGIISTLRKLSPYWKEGKPQIQGLDHDFDADSKEVRA